MGAAFGPWAQTRLEQAQVHETLEYSYCIGELRTPKERDSSERMEPGNSLGIGYRVRKQGKRFDWGRAALDAAIHKGRRNMT
jgi:hypothetical protein